MYYVCRRQKVEAGFMKYLTGKRSLFSGGGMVIFFLLSSCSTFSPTPLEKEKALQIRNETLGRYFSYQERLSPKMTLYDAMARALKYNLDIRVARLQASLAEANLDIKSYDALPQMYLRSGYTYRSHPPKRKYYDAAGNIQGGRVDMDTSSSDISAELSWNILDFGLSYIRAKQAANQLLISQERTKLAIWQVMRDIQMAYWAGVAAQRLEKTTKDLDKEISSILKDLNSRVTQRNLPIESLQIQKNLIKLKQEITRIRENLLTRKLRLADLTGIDPSIKYTFSDNTGYIPLIMRSVSVLDRMAFENRPELRVATYEQRVNQEETKLALQSLLPTVSLTGGVHHTSDTFEQNPSWISAGLQVSWNLLNVFKSGANMEKNSLSQELVKNRQIAIGMSFLIGNRLALMNYHQAVRTYANNLKTFEIEKRIEESIRASSYGNISPKTKIDRVQAHLNRVSAELRLATSYGELQAAMFEIFRSTGVDIFPFKDASNMSVYEVATAIESSIENTDGVAFLTKDTSRAIFRPLPIYQDLLQIQLAWRRNPDYKTPHFRFIKKEGS